MLGFSDAGWSSLAARRAHNPKVTGSNPVPATKQVCSLKTGRLIGVGFWSGCDLLRWIAKKIESSHDVKKSVDQE